MKCSSFGECGSCTLYGMSYEEQLDSKLEKVGGLLSPYYDGEIEIFDSPQSHYRARAEFRIWHEDGGCGYAMGRRGGKGAVVIEECPKVIVPIERAMESLIEKINSSDELSYRLFAVEFLSSTAGDTLVTMIYHRRLGEEWLQEAVGIEKDCGLKVIGRSRKQKVVVSDEYIVEELDIDGKLYRYRHYEGGFTQPNPFVNAKMIGWAMERCRDAEGDLLEAYCGLGNFTIPLSERFDRVLATEISKNSIRAAKENRELNGAENIEFVRMSSEEVVVALEGGREFRRLAGIDLDGYDFRTILVDPPRAGLDGDTARLASRMDRIVYISCNPVTLARDLDRLSSTHRAESAAIFDQFPYTEHVECGVVLRRFGGER